MKRSIDCLENSSWKMKMATFLQSLRRLVVLCTEFFLRSLHQRLGGHIQNFWKRRIGFKSELHHHYDATKCQPMVRPVMPPWISQCTKVLQACIDHFMASTDHSFHLYHLFRIRNADGRIFYLLFPPAITQIGFHFFALLEFRSKIRKKDANIGPFSCGKWPLVHTISPVCIFSATS